MLGTFRFGLAWVVMLSHMPFSPFAINFNLAVTAVVLFYFISGYLMYGSFYKEFQKRPTKFLQMINFYIKRFLRIFPLYWIVLSLTILILFLFGVPKYVALLQQDVANFSKIFLNFILILNNYVFEPFTISVLLPHPLIPPTWSLSTEWHFYLLVPFFFYLLHRRFFIFIFILFTSMIIEFVAFFFTHPLFNSDNFGYRYIFGVLWIFLFGFLTAYDYRSIWIKIIYTIIVFFALFFMFIPATHPFVREIVLGLLLTPVIRPLMKIDFALDPIFGMLSYPIFLSHFFVFDIVEQIIDPIRHKYLYFYTIFIALLLFSLVLAAIQSRIDSIRRRY